MNKAITGLFIGLAFLAPALVSARSSHNKPSKDRTPPTVTSVYITSSNAVSTKAVAGDTITLTFTTSEKVQTPVVLVNAKPVVLRATNSSSNTWVASYKVGTKDPLGKAQYAIGLADMANNVYACSSIKTIFQILVKHCPPTDGSSVTVYKETTPPPPPVDTEAPVIEAHADVHATTEGTTAMVSYVLPAATDNVDAVVEVTCSPASGSEFAVGTTTVTCLASDAAGNDAAPTSFSVVVEQEIVAPPEPELYTMASQPDESHLCGVVIDSWRYCDEAVTYSFTDAVGEGTKTIDLGAGSGMGNGTIETVTIAGQMDTFHPWDITISCFTDAAYTTACPDWEAVTDDANESSDGKYWTADFSSLNRTFTPAYYYRMEIYDTEWDKPAYGSEDLKEPYWEIVGLE